MSYNEWKKVKFSDVVEMNPKITLKKGTLAKKVSMKDLKEFNRKIQSYKIEEYKSGTKFQNGDTLFARITPCLENGKTAYVDILEENEVAFGSTEFIVLRAKSGITDDKFVYYLSISPDFRNLAIKSMTGTSGRQRVQNSVLANTLIEIPSLKEQKRIATILSTLDDKIELNNQINKTLEQIAQTIFKHWFVDFEFPNEEGQPYKSSGGKFVESELGMIPEGWRVSTLQEVCNIKYGKNLPTKKLLKKGYPVYGGNGVIGFYDEYLYEEPQVIVACRGAASGKVLNTVPYSFVTNNSLVLELKSSIINYEYLKFYCSYYSFYQYTTGSAQPQLTIQNIKDFSILVPKKNILNRFHQIIKPIEEIIYQLSVQSEHLAQLRDTLLPKLMSGEIRVPEAEEVVENHV